jgi:flap endonuclease-1
MGVKSFFEMLIKNVLSNFEGQKICDLGEDVTLGDLEGERVGVDASTMIYQALLALQFVTSLTDSSGKPTGHINTIFNKVLMLMVAGVDQVWIFDSPKPNALKKRELAERAKRRAKATDDKRAFKMTSEHVKDIQDLLTQMGILYIVAPPGVEAEQYGAILTQGEDPFCKYMMSGDSDVLMFGGNLLRPMTKRSASGKSKKTVYATYELDTILKEFGINREELVTMGVCLGSDFAPKTVRIGPASVHNAFKNGKLALTTEQQAAHDYFMSDIEMTSADLVKNKYDKEKLVSFLTRRGFNEERITKRIDAAYDKK